MNASINAKRNSSIFFTCLFIFLLIPFLGISGIKENVSESQYQMWQVCSTLFMGMLALSVASDIRFKWPLGLFILFQGTILLSSYLNHGFQYGIIVVTVASIILFALIQSPYFKDLINAMCVIVIVSVIINFVTLISDYNVHDAMFFIGGKNAFSMFLIPGAFLLFINTYIHDKKLNALYCISIVVCFLSVFIAGSATGIVVSVTALIIYILSGKLKIKSNMYLFVLFLAYLIPLVFMDDFISTDFWYDFTAMLGKDYTLTSRTIIWEEAKNIISDNWFLGAGRGEMVTFIGASYESHNMILEILIEGGVIALAIFVLIILKVFQNINLREKKSRIVFVALCAALVNGLTESTINNYFVTIILAVACRFAEESESLKKVK